MILKNIKSIFKKPKVVVFVEEELLHESFFGDNKNNYHPNEMTAKFSEWYLLQILNSIKTFWT